MADDSIWKKEIKLGKKGKKGKKGGPPAPKAQLQPEPQAPAGGRPVSIWKRELQFRKPVELAIPVVPVQAVAEPAPAELPAEEPRTRFEPAPSWEAPELTVPFDARGVEPAPVHDPEPPSTQPPSTHEWAGAHEQLPPHEVEPFEERSESTVEPLDWWSQDTDPARPAGGEEPEDSEPVEALEHPLELEPDHRLESPEPPAYTSWFDRPAAVEPLEESSESTAEPLAWWSQDADLSGPADAEAPERGEPVEALEHPLDLESDQALERPEPPAQTRWFDQTAEVELVEAGDHVEGLVEDAVTAPEALVPEPVDLEPVAPEPVVAALPAALAVELQPESAEPAEPEKKEKTRGRKAAAEAASHGAKNLVGLRIGSSQLAAACVHNNGTAEVVQLSRARIPRGIVSGGEVRDLEGLTRELKSFFSQNKLPRRGVRLGIASNRIGVRVLEVPKLDDPKLFENSIRFHAQETLPIAVTDAILDYVELGDGRRAGARAHRSSSARLRAPRADRPPRRSLQSARVSSSKASISRPSRFSGRWPLLVRRTKSRPRPSSPSLSGTSGRSSPSRTDGSATSRVCSSGEAGRSTSPSHAP